MLGMNINNPKPRVQDFPSMPRVVASEMKAHGPFLHLVAKLTIAIIWSSSPMKSIRPPHPILENKSREDLALGRSPRIPNHRMLSRGSETHGFH
jgi:hypothetical protein